MENGCAIRGSSRCGSGSDGRPGRVFLNPVFYADSSHQKSRLRLGGAECCRDRATAGRSAPKSSVGRRARASWQGRCIVSARLMGLAAARRSDRTRPAFSFGRGNGEPELLFQGPSNPPRTVLALPDGRRCHLIRQCPLRPAATASLLQHPVSTGASIRVDGPDNASIADHR